MKRSFAVLIDGNIRKVQEMAYVGGDPVPFVFCPQFSLAGKAEERWNTPCHKYKYVSKRITGDKSVYYYKRAE